MSELKTFLKIVGGDVLQKGFTGFGDIAINSIKLRITVDGNILLTGSTESRVYNSNFFSDYFGTGFALLQREDGSHLLVDNITIRNSLYASIFLVDTIRASNGYLFISDCALLASNLQILFIDTLYTLSLNNNTFQLNDLVWYKARTSNGITGIKGQILSNPVAITGSNLLTYYEYSFKAIYGLGLLLSGKTIVRVGNTENNNRQGSVYFSSNGSNTPFMDIYDGVSSFQYSDSGSFSSINKLKVRLGNLYGITDTLLQPLGYGLYSLNVFLKGSIFANNGKIGNWTLRDGNLYANSTSNAKLYIGSGLYNNSNTSVYFDSLGYFSLKDKLLFDKLNLLIKGKITSTLGTIGSWNITLNSLLSNNFKLDSSNLQLLIGLITAYNSGSGIFIGRDIYNSASNLSDTLVYDNNSDLLLFDNDTSSAYNYSDYKLFIGLSLGNSLLYDGKNVLLSGKITTTLGSIANWDISSNSISKNNTILLSTQSLYFTGAEYPQPSSTASMITNFSVGLTINITASTYDLRTTLYKYIRSNVKLPKNVYNLSFLYNISSSLLNLLTYSSLYLTVFLSTTANLLGAFLQVNYITYKLIGGNEDRTINVLYLVPTANTYYLYFRIIAKGAALPGATKYDVLTLNPVTVGIYDSLTLISLNGLFLFNNPSNYIKLGSNNNLQLALFKGTLILTKNLTVYLNIYHYGKTFAAATDLLGTTSDRFTINSNFLYENAVLNLVGGTSSALIKYDGAKVSIDKPIKPLSIFIGSIQKDAYWDSKLDASNKGIANGYAGLDPSGKVFTSQLPGTLLKYIGTWDPTTNTPTLVTPDTTKPGNVYTVSMLGSRFGISWKLGDWAIYNSDGVILKSDNSDDVLSVNGQTGIVVIKQVETSSVALKTNGTLTISNKLVGSSFNGSTNVIIGHLTQSIASGDHTNNTILGSLTYDAYGHLTQTNSINIYSLFSGSAPISFSNGTSSLNTSSNLRLSSNKLDTVQDIQTTSTPTFSQLSIGECTGSSNAVHGGRSLTITTLNGITIDTATAQDLTSNRSWKLGLTGQALALHNLNTNGLIARTSAGNVSARTITGATNQISLVNGDGISGNPTISISSIYPGQTSITTLGTITTGAWSGSKIGTVYGGTNNDTYTSNKLLTYNNSKIESIDNLLYSNSTLYLTGSQLISNNVGSPIFASDFGGSGWRIDSGSTATFLNLTVRGTMNIYLLLINQIRATNGSLLVTSVGKVKSSSWNNSSSINLVFDALTRHGFLLNDLIRAQRVTNDNSLVYKIDLLVTLVTSLLQIKCKVISGAGYVLLNIVGALFVRIGNKLDLDRQGSVYLCADGQYAPYIDILDGVSSHLQFNTADHTKVRLGKLLGISNNDLHPQGYGLYSDNVYLRGSIIADNGKISNWLITLNGLSNDKNILLNALLGFIRVSDGILLNLDGTFLFKTDLNNYIKNYDSTLLIKTSDIQILTLKFLLSSNDLYMKFGAMTSFSTGSGIYIGKDLSTSPSNLSDTLLTGTDDITFDSDTVSANSYSDYKLFIGLSSGNFLRYDGYNVLLTGKIIAKSGTIANWNITLNSLQTGNYNTNGTMYFGTSGLSLSNAFIVSSAGNLTASSAKLSGLITSSAGKIGGWYLSSDSIYSGSNSFNNTSSMYIGQSGLSIRNLFRVNSWGSLYANNALISGKITSDEGKIGCWTITDDSLYSGSVNEFANALNIYIGQSGLSVRDKFIISNNGALIASDALITGLINSSIGNIGNWLIDLNGLSSGLILINSFLNYIQVSDKVRFNGDGSFLLKTNLNSYIRNNELLLLIKTNAIMILTLKFMLDSIGLNLRFGLLKPFSSGSGIFIGKDNTLAPSENDDTLISSGSDLLSLGGTASSAMSYSDYKMFIGDSTNNYLKYDGINVLLKGAISASLGNIAGWNINLNSLYKDSVSMNVNSQHWNITSSLPTASSTVYTLTMFDISNTASISPYSKHFIYKTINYAMSTSSQYIFDINIATVTGYNDAGLPTKTCTMVFYLDNSGTLTLIPYQYKLVSGIAISLKVNFTYRPLVNNAKLTICFILKNLTLTTISNGSWLAFDNYDLKIKQYNSLVLLSNNGLFIYNNPNDYLRVGKLTNNNPEFSIYTNKLNVTNLYGNTIFADKIAPKSLLLVLGNTMGFNSSTANFNGRIQIHNSTSLNILTTTLKNQISYTGNTLTGSTFIANYTSGWKYALVLQSYSGSALSRGSFGLPAVNATYNWYFNGSIGATGDIVSNISSDRRLKLNITIIPNALLKLDTISGYNFKFNQFAQLHLKGLYKNGVIAQLLKLILPLAVVLRLDGYLAVDYNQIIPLLILSIKLLNRLIKELKNK